MKKKGKNASYVTSQQGKQTSRNVIKVFCLVDRLCGRHTHMRIPHRQTLGIETRRIKGKTILPSRQPSVNNTFRKNFTWSFNSQSRISSLRPVPLPDSFFTPNVSRLHGNNWTIYHNTQRFLPTAGYSSRLILTRVDGLMVTSEQSITIYHLPIRRLFSAAPQTGGHQRIIRHLVPLLLSAFFLRQQLS